MNIFNFLANKLEDSTLGSVEMMNQWITQVPFSWGDLGEWAIASRGMNESLLGFWNIRSNYIWKDDNQLHKLTDLDSLLESHFSHSLLEIFWINLSSWNTFHHYWNSCSSLQVNAHIATLGNQAYANKAWWWLKHPTCRYVVHGATKCHNISFYHGSTEYSVWGMVTCHFLAAYAVTPYEEGTFLFPSSDTLSGRGSINI